MTFLIILHLTAPDTEDIQTLNVIEVSHLGCGRVPDVTANETQGLPEHGRLANTI